MKTTDLYPELSPFERHIAFIKDRHGNLSQQRYYELLKAHLKTPKTFKIPTQTNLTLLQKIKLWLKTKN